MGVKLTTKVHRRLRVPRGEIIRALNEYLPDNWPSHAEHVPPDAKLSFVGDGVELEWYNDDDRT